MNPNQTQTQPIRLEFGNKLQYCSTSAQESIEVEVSIKLLVYN